MRDFNGGYIKASQEAYDLLVKEGIANKFKYYVKNWKYIYVKNNDNDIDYCDDEFIQVMNEKEIIGTLQQDKHLLGEADEKSS